MSSTPGPNENAGDGDKKPKLTKGQKKAANKKKNRAAERDAAENDAAGTPGPAPGPSAVPSTEESPQESAHSEAGGLNEAMKNTSLANDKDEADTQSSKSNSATKEDWEKEVEHRDLLPSHAERVEQSELSKTPQPLKEIAGALYKGAETLNPESSKLLKHPAKPGFGVTNHDVLTNHFSIRLDNKEIEDSHYLFEYHITNIDSGHTRAKKRTLIEAAVQQCAILRDSQDYWVTDNMKKVISWQDLSEWEPGRYTARAPGHVLDTFHVDNYDKRFHTNTPLRLGLLFFKKWSVDDLQAYAKLEKPDYSGRQETVAAMNLFLTKHLFGPGQPNFQAGKDRFFLKSGWESINSPGKLAYRGYSMQVRPAMGQLMLNINTSTGLFYDAITVAEYLELGLDPSGLLGVRVWVDLKRNMSSAQADSPANIPDLDTEQARTKTISEFGGAAGRTEAYSRTNEAGKEIKVSVWDHMKDKYSKHKNMNYNTDGSINSICVNTNPVKASTKTWFLAEDLVILPHQLYKRKMDPELTAEMIKKACRKPDVNVDAILQEGLKSIGVKQKQKPHERPQSFQDFGMSIDPRMLRVPARVIDTPQLSLRVPTTVDVVRAGGRSRGKWQLDLQWKFLTTNQTLTGQPFFLIPPHFQVQTLQHFWKYYTQHGTPTLGNLPAQFGNTNSRTIHRIDDIEEAVNVATKTKPSIIIMVLPDKNKRCLPFYAAFKSAVDQVHGLPSLCLSAAKLKERNSKSQTASYNPTSPIANYAYNVGMKLNIRLGNTNHSIESTNFNMLPKDANNNPDTLILGADVIHPGAASVEGTPSIAALVGSVDDKYAKYLGSMRTQRYDPKAESKEIIDDTSMKAMASERLEAWKKVNGRYPSNILYYRDGVGDSQFGQVLDNEVRMIREAYSALASTNPKITALVVVKRHNVRLYPRDQAKTSDKDNCLPGTVVDSSITHPHNFDFFLTSHDALQGTARPTHYTVLLNEMAFSATGIQDLTHKLCYTYQRSTTSVSYVPPAYYADHLCERGRCYLMEFFEGGVGLRGGRRSRWRRGLRRLGGGVGEVGLGILGGLGWMGGCFGCRGWVGLRGCWWRVGCCCSVFTFTFALRCFE